MYLNQPNGFLFVSDSVLMCEQAEWPTFDYTVALLVDNVNCVTTLTNCEFVKVSSNLGYGFANASSLTINGGTSEIAAPNFHIVNGSETHINGYKTHFWANSTEGFFKCDDGAVAYIACNDMKFDKTAGASGATNGLINTASSSGITARFNQVTMKHQNRATIFNSSFSSKWTASDIRIRDSFVSDGAIGRAVSMGDSNLAQGFNSVVIGNFTTVAGAGTLASIVAFGGTSCSYGVQITGAVGATCTVTTKNAFPIGIQAQQRYMGLECVLGVGAGTTSFYGTLRALYYDDAGSLSGTQDLSDGAGGVAHLVQGVAGTQPFKTVRTILNVPPNCTDIALEFGTANTVQQFLFGGIRVY
jgi:hypothetical protein